MCLRSLLTASLVLAVVLSPTALFGQSWYDVELGIGSGSSGDNVQLVPGLDRAKVLCLLSKCLIDYVTAEYDSPGSYLIYDSVRHCARYSSYQFYSANSTVGDGTCQIQSFKLAPCIYLNSSNLDTAGACYIWLYAEIYLTHDSGYYIVNSACYKVDNVNFSATIDNIESLTVQRVTSPSDWIYPIYLNTTGQGNANFSSYLTRNCPVSVNDTTPVFNSQYQQYSTALQLPSHWSGVWLSCASGNTGSNLLAMYSSIKQRLDRNHIIYADSAMTVPALGASPAVSGPAGYIDLPYLQFAPLTDFDRGGQCDWSEYFRGMDMRNPADDNPAVDDTPSINESDIIVIEPDPIPGQDNLDNAFDDEVQDPNADMFAGTKSVFDSRMQQLVNNNSNYNQIKALINPAGFRPDQPLPIYTVTLNRRGSSNTFFGVNLQLPDISIDFEFLRVNPWRDIWTIVRGILCTALFTLTILTILDMYEKALAWSA